MKFILVFVCLLVAISALSEEQAWEDFKKIYSKTYKNLREEKLRFQIFKSNMDMINEHNRKYEKGEESWSMKINQFGDMTKDEFKEIYLGYRRPNVEFIGTFEQLTNLTPKYVDWREKGAVLSVKQQLGCGSCWAFSAIGAVEGQNALKNNIKIDLSAQELVSCSNSEGNKGCRGGTMDFSFEYIRKNGIASENAYPYIHQNGTCEKAGKERSNVKLTGYKDVEPNESALQSAVASVGPVSVAIDSSGIKFYDDGVYDDPNCKNGKDDLDHAVLVVGYGTVDNKDYWIVKNSWSKWWGDYGYIKMSRNKNNQCGIALFPSYPILA